MASQEVNSGYDQIRSRNSEAYAIFFDIEVILRELIAIQLEQVNGNRWQKTSLPPDIKEKVKSAIDYERSIPWSRLVPHHPLYFTDFPDLKKIVVMGTNWPIFSKIFGAKVSTDVSLSDIESIRNKIAHNRIICQADMDILDATKAKIVGCVPPGILNKAKTAVTVRIPITAIIEEIEIAMTTAMKGIADGVFISPEIIVRLEATNAWWFDGDYLGQNVESILLFVQHCREYAKILQGLGQNAVRRKWVADNDVIVVGKNAKQSIDKLLANSRRTYA